MGADNLSTMNWKAIRLELASTSEHPAGSVGRVYLIRLPLLQSGAIDHAALMAAPAQATVRRFWPSTPDRSGFVRPGRSGLEIRFSGACADLETSAIEVQSLGQGSLVHITEGDGKRLPFRVAAISNLAPRLGAGDLPDG